MKILAKFQFNWIEIIHAKINLKFLAKRSSQFLHLTEVVVNVAMSTPNIELSSNFHNKQGYRNASQKGVLFIFIGNITLG